MLKRITAMVLCLLLLSAAAMAEGSFTMAGYDSMDSHDWNNNFAFTRIEEKSGVHFIYRQYSNEEEWTNIKASMKANDEDLPDLLFKANLSAKETQDLYEKGVLVDLKPYLEQYAPNLTALLKAHPEWEDAITLADGAIVTLPNINQLQNNNAVWVNTQWLKRLSLSMPTNAEEFTQMLRAFKTKDPNNNGKSDEVPMTFTGMWDLRWLAHAFGIYSNDYYVVLEDGVVRQTVTSDENRAFLEWCHQLYAEGLLDNTGFTSTESTKQITDTSSPILFGVVLGPSIMNLLPSSQLDNYDVMMPLAYEGKQVYRQLLNDLGMGTFAVTSACPDPAALVAWVDFFYTEEGCFLTQAGLKDVDYEIYSDGTWHWLADASTINDTLLPDYTIASGAMMPGYTPVEYQSNYDDPQTRRAVEMLVQLNSYSRHPYPSVNLTDDARSRLNAIWGKLGDYCEVSMARFVTGDYKLNDETWFSFCAEAERRGLSEMVTIWQDALKK